VQRGVVGVVGFGGAAGGTGGGGVGLAADEFGAEGLEGDGGVAWCCWWRLVLRRVVRLGWYLGLTESAIVWHVERTTIESRRSWMLETTASPSFASTLPLPTFAKYCWWREET